MKLLRMTGSAMLVLGVLAFAAGAQPAEAAGFIKFDGIDGEAKDSNHDKWIDVMSVDFGDGRTGARPSSGSAAEPMMGAGELTFTKHIDKATPKLQEACASGKHIKDAVLHVRKAGGDAATGGKRATYFKYEMKNVMVTSCSTNRGSGEGRPTETISLNYEEIKTTYSGADEKAERKAKKKGNVETEWKVEEGER